MSGPVNGVCMYVCIMWWYTLQQEYIHSGHPTLSLSTLHVLLHALIVLSKPLLVLVLGFRWQFECYLQDSKHPKEGWLVPGTVLLDRVASSLAGNLHVDVLWHTRCKILTQAILCHTYKCSKHIDWIIHPNKLIRSAICNFIEWCLLAGTQSVDGHAMMTFRDFMAALFSIFVTYQNTA